SRSCVTVPTNQTRQRRPPPAKGSLQHPVVPVWGLGGDAQTGRSFVVTCRARCPPHTAHGGASSSPTLGKNAVDAQQRQCQSSAPSAVVWRLCLGASKPHGLIRLPGWLCATD